MVVLAELKQSVRVSASKFDCIDDFSIGVELQIAWNAILAFRGLGVEAGVEVACWVSKEGVSLHVILV